MKAQSDSLVVEIIDDKLTVDFIGIVYLDAKVEDYRKNINTVVIQLIQQMNLSNKEANKKFEELKFKIKSEVQNRLANRWFNE